MKTTTNTPLILPLLSPGERHFNDSDSKRNYFLRQTVEGGLTLTIEGDIQGVRSITHPLSPATASWLLGILAETVAS